MGGLGDEHAAGSRRRLHAGGQVRGVAHGGVVHPQVVPDAADDDEAGVEPDSHLHGHAALGLELLAVIAHGPLDPERCVRGPARAVLVGDRRAEERHDAVARVLVDGAFEAMDLGRDQLEAAVDDPVDVLGIEPFGQRREAGDVREQHGDLPSLALHGGSGLEDLVGEMLGRVGGDRRRRRRRSRRGRRRCLWWRSLKAGPALAAEAKARRSFSVALRALPGQRGSALAAEPHARRILELTGGALHGDTLHHSIPGRPHGLPDSGRLAENRGGAWAGDSPGAHAGWSPRRGQRRVQSQL